MSNPIIAAVLKGALSGALAAFTVDLHAFATWKSLQEASTYNWRTAITRWVIGAATGALSGVGIGAAG